MEDAEEGTETFVQETSAHIDSLDALAYARDVSAAPTICCGARGCAEVPTKLSKSGDSEPHRGSTMFFATLMSPMPSPSCSTTYRQRRVSACDGSFVWQSFGRF